MAERHITSVLPAGVLGQGRYRPDCSCGWTGTVGTLTAAHRAATDHYYATLPGAQEDTDG